MELPQESGRQVSVALALSLLVLAAALALAACGGGELTPPSDLPSWPAGASPSPAVSIPVGPGMSFEGTPSGSGTDGWEFRPYVDIEVTALGYFDDNADGLVQDHWAGIFDMATKKGVVTTTVGPNSTLDGAYRWEAVTPWVLKAGHSYVVAIWGRYEPGQPYDTDTYSRPAGAVWAPEIKHGRYRATLGPWGFPDQVQELSELILTANFKFKPVSASSPSP